MLFFLIERKEDNIYDFLQFKKIARWSGLRAALLGAGGGATLVIFTFGFGGLQPLAKIFSGLLFLSCVIELLLGLIYRNKNNGGTK